MKSQLYIIALMIGLFSCKGASEKAGHEEHEEAKFQYTIYTNEFELFAETAAFEAGEEGNVLAHFSTLPDFRALENAKVTMVMQVGGQKLEQTVDKPLRKGIYSFNVKPEKTGKGSIRFDITSSKGNYEVAIPEITVFNNHEAAHEAAESREIKVANSTPFTKEQSWKVDFATGYAQNEAFGQMIKTTAHVEASQGEEQVVTAGASGVVHFSADNMLEGKDVRAGQVLCSISGNGIAENNINVRYSEAKSNYDKASADYERAKMLVKDKIVSEKDFAAIKNQYENARAIFNNMNRSAGKSGQSTASPIGGFIRQVMVRNGAYVEAGQPLFIVSQNRTLLLTAEVPQRYASVLSTIKSANIQNTVDNTTYTLEELGGKVLAYGKSTNEDNFMLPVHLQIANKGNFVPGSFVEIYLKTISDGQALTVPLTALLEEQGSYFVWVQITPELFEKREVTPGGNDGIRVAIKKGLAAGERIILRGAMSVKLAQSTGALDAHAGHVH